MARIWMGVAVVAAALQGSPARAWTDNNTATIGSYARSAASGSEADAKSIKQPLPYSGATQSSQGGNTANGGIVTSASMEAGSVRSATASGSASGSSASTGGQGNGSSEVAFAAWNSGTRPVSYAFSATIETSSSGDGVATGAIYYSTSDQGIAIKNYLSCTYDPRHWYFNLCDELYQQGPRQGSISIQGILEPGQSATLKVSIGAGASTQGRAGSQYVGSASASFSASFRAGPPIGGSFEWSVPDRYGFDDDGDGLVDSFAPDGALDATPDGFRVDFTDGLPETCNTAVTRTWIIDGLEVLADDPRIISYDPHGCRFSYSFPDEGRYQVSLEISDGSNQLDLITDEVAVQDWVIVSIGDSVASGEGVPEVPGPVQPGWQNRQCHRSALAGPARAARQIELMDPKTSVTFVHLACSGASVDTGLLGSYVGQEPGAPIPPQVVQLQEQLDGREIDAVTVSIGANDVLFSDLVTTCFLHGDAPLTQECDQSGHIGSARDAFNQRLPDLAPRYDELGATLAAAPLQIARDRVYVTEYFDPVRDQTGAYCDQEILEEVVDIESVGISAAEAEWAGTDMLPALNHQVDLATRRNSWRYVGGVFSAFRAHGYCSTGSWIRRLTESLAQQGNKDGTLHPNATGHDVYAGRIYDTLRADLYTGGSLDAPRLPRED